MDVVVVAVGLAGSNGLDVGIPMLLVLEEDGGGDDHGDNELVGSCSG